MSAKKTVKRKKTTETEKSDIPFIILIVFIAIIGVIVTIKVLDIYRYNNRVGKTPPSLECIIDNKSYYAEMEYDNWVSNTHVIATDKNNINYNINARKNTLVTCQIKAKIEQTIYKENNTYDIEIAFDSVNDDNDINYTLSANEVKDGYQFSYYLPEKESKYINKITVKYNSYNYKNVFGSFYKLLSSKEGTSLVNYYLNMDIN